MHYAISSIEDLATHRARCLPFCPFSGPYGRMLKYRFCAPSKSSTNRHKACGLTDPVWGKRGSDKQFLPKSSAF